ncbi:Protein NHR-33 [Aphelenchoides avenae]|nr:Protein NHR-33 [Aphelenchus avenae]
MADIISTRLDSTGSEGIPSVPSEKHYCSVCGDDSDGLHFGQYTCRACAAFFRRTVSLKLQYTCKHDNNCDIEKSARNMCRACRFEKCLQVGMLTSAVQHARDGLGKRKDAKDKPSPEGSDTPDVKIPKSVGDSNGSPPHLLNGHGTLATALGIPTTAGTPLNAFYTTLPQPTTASYTTLTTASAVDGATILHIGMPNGADNGYDMHRNGSTVPYMQLGHESAFTALRDPEMKYLSKMLEGYHHFLSLRKASYTLIEECPMFKNRSAHEIPQSNFGTSKKICKIEASLIMDTVEKFFIPFGSLPPEEKNRVFEGFYCIFSNAERAFRTHQTFPAGDDRLLMPDGGYIRLSELQKFYENNSLIRGDPAQVARIFESAMSYIVSVVVAHMRSVDLTEVELMALAGMFLWKDKADVSEDTAATIRRTRDNILVDLHNYYRTSGYAEHEVTIKTANLFLLIPKLEHASQLMKENFQITEFFNLMDPTPCALSQQFAESVKCS